MLALSLVIRVPMDCCPLPSQLDAERTKNRDLKRTKDSFAEQLIKARDDARSVVEDKLMGEMQRLQEQNKRELDQIRANTRDVRCCGLQHRVGCEASRLVLAVSSHIVVVVGFVGFVVVVVVCHKSMA